MYLGSASMCFNGLHWRALNSRPHQSNKHERRASHVAGDGNHACLVFSILIHLVLHMVRLLCRERTRG